MAKIYVAALLASAHGVVGTQELPTDLDASSTTAIAFQGAAYTGTIPTGTSNTGADCSPGYDTLTIVTP